MELYKNVRLPVQPNAPWVNDILDRKKVADYLTPVLASATQPFVIGLDSPYGTGKTFFLENWRCDLEKQGYRTVYFNAWETDFSQNALFAFMTAIKRELKKKAANNGIVKNKFKEAIGTVGSLIKPELGTLLLRLSVRKILGSEGVSDIAEFVGLNAGDFDDLTSKIASAGLKDQEDAEVAMENFKKYLSEAVAALVEEEKDPAKKKLIVFVDELDRCRPDYAIRILECIKHFFSVDGIVFILAIDETQVRNAINAIYGPSFDSDGYLRRFIDWRYKIPKPSALNFCRYLVKRFNLVDVKEAHKDDSFYSVSSLAESLSAFAHSYNLSLREIEQCYTEANLYLRTSKKIAPFTNALGFILLIRLKFPDLLNKAIKNSIYIDELLNALEPNMSTANLDEFYKPWSKLRSILHSWFLNQHSANLLTTEINKLLNEANELNTSLTTNRRQELEMKSQQLSDAITFFKDTNSHFRDIFSDRSMAEIVCRQLDTADLHAVI